jgi:5'-deoxynucleotidase YfbR-like HD superfamily hydrolase
MSEKQLSELDTTEEKGIILLSNQFPEKVDAYTYRVLLEEVFYKDTLEAQIVKFFDHLDGFGEALHEVYG